LLIARGGVEAHGAKVLASAAARGLRVVERAMPEPGVRGLLHAVADLEEADIVSLCSPVDPPSRQLLFHSSHAVLANSGREPFGLVGLETMAAGGVACTGCSGEDYVIPGRNALVLETEDPQEFLRLFGTLRAHPAQERALRRAGRATALQYRWSEIVQRVPRAARRSQRVVRTRRKKETRMFYQVTIQPANGVVGRFDVFRHAEGWADDLDLLQALYTHPTYDAVYDLAQDDLPPYVEDIRGRVYDEPARMLARVRTDNGIPVVQYVGIVEDPG
jgi:hypothetical protein